MADEIILDYVKSIDARTARMESAMTTAMQIHQAADNDKHDEIDGRLKSLEISRAKARAGLAVVALGGTGAGAKLGMLGKLASLFGGAP